MWRGKPALRHDRAGRASDGAVIACSLEGCSELRGRHMSHASMRVNLTTAGWAGCLSACHMPDAACRCAAQGESALPGQRQVMPLAETSFHRLLYCRFRYGRALLRLSLAWLEPIEWQQDLYVSEGAQSSRQALAAALLLSACIAWPARRVVTKRRSSNYVRNPERLLGGFLPRVHWLGYRVREQMGPH